MSSNGTAFISGVYEHPGRVLPDKSVSQIHTEVALGALADAGLSLSDVDGYFCATDAPGAGALSMAEYMGLRLSYMDSTDSGGASPLCHVGHAAAAIAAGKCSVALITVGGKPRTSVAEPADMTTPEAGFEQVFGPSLTASGYALAARRHMYEYGTTSEQLAEVKVATRSTTRTPFCRRS
jgi:acetyl-CoA C-acetyltransferase